VQTTPPPIVDRTSQSFSGDIKASPLGQVARLWLMRAQTSERSSCWSAQSRLDAAFSVGDVPRVLMILRRLMCSGSTALAV
jgi:hypothetical protein